jgi:hypothetical protein
LTPHHLATELAPYLSGKGTLKFPLAKEIPLNLIANVAAQLAAEKKLWHR